MAQSVEHVIGNDEVIGPNPISSSITKALPIGRAFCYATIRYEERYGRCGRKGDFFLSYGAASPVAVRRKRSRIRLAAP